MREIGITLNIKESLIDRIDEVLPQTQCEKCGYAGCRPYAEALVKGDDINKCPPGGNETILALSKLLSTPFLALNPKHGKIKMHLKRPRRS